MPWSPPVVCTIQPTHQRILPHADIPTAAGLPSDAAPAYRLKHLHYGRLTTGCGATCVGRPSDSPPGDSPAEAGRQCTGSYNPENACVDVHVVAAPWSRQEWLWSALPSASLEVLPAVNLKLPNTPFPRGNSSSSLMYCSVLAVYDSQRNATNQTATGQHAALHPSSAFGSQHSVSSSTRHPGPLWCHCPGFHMDATPRRRWQWRRQRQHKLPSPRQRLHVLHLPKGHEGTAG